MITRNGIALQSTYSHAVRVAVRSYVTKTKLNGPSKGASKGTSTPLRSASTSPNTRKGPVISMPFGIAMMLMGLVGWVYYPKLADFEDRKREEREQKALLEAAKNATEQMPPS